MRMSFSVLAVSNEISVIRNETSAMTMSFSVLAISNEISDVSNETKVVLAAAHLKTLYINQHRIITAIKMIYDMNDPVRLVQALAKTPNLRCALNLRISWQLTHIRFICTRL